MTPFFGRGGYTSFREVWTDQLCDAEAGCFVSSVAAVFGAFCNESPGRDLGAVDVGLYAAGHTADQDAVASRR